MATAFQITNNTTQSVSASGFVQVNFQTEVHDGGGGFNAGSPSDAYVVPSGITRMLLTAGIETSAATGTALYIRKSTDSGSSWTTYIIARSGDLANTAAVVMDVSGGDWISAWVFDGGGSGFTIQNTDTVFLAGVELRATCARYERITSAQSITASTRTHVDYNSEIFDDLSNAYDISADSYTVSAADVGKFGLFGAGVRTAANETCYLQIEKTSDADGYARDHSGADTQTSVFSGPMRLYGTNDFGATYLSTSAASISNNTSTHFGFLIDEPQV